MSARKNKHRNINLLPQEGFDRTTLGRILKWALTTFRIIVIFVEFVVVLGFLSRFYLDVTIGNLDEEINQKSALIEARYDFEKEFRTIQLKLSLLSNIEQDLNKNSTAIEYIRQNIPTDTQLLSYSKTGSTFTIRGASLSELSVSMFLGSIKSNWPDSSLLRIEKESNSPLIIFTIETKT